MKKKEICNQIKILINFKWHKQTMGIFTIIYRVKSIQISLCGTPSKPNTASLIRKVVFPHLPDRQAGIMGTEKSQASVKVQQPKVLWCGGGY